MTMSRLRFAIVTAMITTTSGFNAAAPLVDHMPHAFGGAAADSEFLSPANGQPSTQFVADRFTVGDGAPIRRIVWWGFEWNDNPPAAETFRIRIYDADATTALPDSVASETVTASASRMATGRQVAFGVRPDELRYELDFPQAIWLAPGESYWLEITQMGDLSHTFGWESSIPPGYDGFALRFSDLNGWLNVPNGGDLAFQLWSIPEPATLCLLACGALFARRRLLARDYAGRAP